MIFLNECLYFKRRNSWRIDHNYFSKLWNKFLFGEMRRYRCKWIYLSNAFMLVRSHIFTNLILFPFSAFLLCWFWWNVYHTIHEQPWIFESSICTKALHIHLNEFRRILIDWTNNNNIVYSMNIIYQSQITWNAFVTEIEKCSVCLSKSNNK